MKLMKRNLKEITYCDYLGEVALIDENGYETGEKALAYSEPKTILANVSAAKGVAQTEVFGNIDSYDKVVLIDDMNCTIGENSVLFIDIAPVFIDGVPKYDYIVKRVAKSLNVISVAVSKVKVS